MLLVGVLAAAAGRGADNGAFTPDQAKLLRQARTVSLEIKQGWAWGAEDQAEKAEASDGAAGDKKPREPLPLAECTKAALEFAGWKVVGPGEPADMKLRVDTYGSALGADYVGTVMGHQYSGAELSGSVTLFHQGQEMIHEKFEGTVHPPTSINRYYSQPQDAPYERLRPEYLEAVYKVEETVFGLPPVLAAVKKAEDEHRVAATKVLLARGEAASVPALVELLRAKDERLGAIAATALGAFGEASAFPALLAALRDDPDYPANPAELSEEQLNSWTQFDHEFETAARRDQAADVAMLSRQEAVQWALLQNPASDKVPRLAAMLRDRSTPPMARCGVALVLGPLVDPIAGEALLSALKDESFVVRAAAISALSTANYHGQRPVADALLALTTDPQPFVRNRARAALGNFALEIVERHMNAHTTAAAMQDDIARSLEDPDPLVRLGAVRLTQYAVEGGTAALGRVLQSDPVPAVREAAVDMLLARHRAELEPVLAPALADPDEGTRSHALLALDSPEENNGDGEQKAHPPLPESAAKPLLAMMDVDTPPEAAWHVLERVQGEGVNGVLLAAAQRDGARPVFREIAVIELARRGDRHATPLIITLLDRSGELRFGYLLVDAAAKLDDPALLDPLFVVMRQGAPAARLLAVRTLGKMSHTRSVGPLIAALRPAEASDSELAGAIREALQSLTGQENSGSNGWLRWWKENSGKPIVRPVPKKPVEEAPAEEPAEPKAEAPKAD
ncbi:HEAT repeat [Opitutus sp. GAS368]|jgi:HEAT repeat protein|nr:HEAT repeat [Opitutus sp. GAS368]